MLISTPLISMYCYPQALSSKFSINLSSFSLVTPPKREKRLANRTLYQTSRPQNLTSNNVTKVTESMHLAKILRISHKLHHGPKISNFRSKTNFDNPTARDTPSNRRLLPRRLSPMENSTAISAEGDIPSGSVSILEHCPFSQLTLERSKRSALCKGSFEKRCNKYDCYYSSST